MILISFYPKRSLKRTTASLQFDIGGAKLKHCIYCKIFCDSVLIFFWHRQSDFQSGPETVLIAAVTQKILQ